MPGSKLEPCILMQLSPATRGFWASELGIVLIEGWCLWKYKDLVKKKKIFVENLINSLDSD